MKKHAGIILTLALGACLWACRDSRPLDSEFPWTPVRPDFDSLAVALDRLHMERDHNWGRQLAAMDSIADSDGRLPLKWRTLFFRAIYGAVGGDNGGRSPRELLRGAMDMCDSARYPYDYNRMLDVMVNIDPEALKITKYRTWSHLYDYASDAGLTHWSANLLLQMANVEQETGLNETAYAHYEKARTLFNRCGNTLFSSYIVLNQANALRDMGRHEGADSLYRRLMADGHITADTSMTVMVHLNSYLNIPQPEHLLTAYGLVANRHSRLVYLPVIYTRLARHSMEAGRADSARMWIDRAMAIRDSLSNPDDKAEITDGYIAVYGRRGLLPDPVGEHERYVAFRAQADSIASASQLESLIMATHIREFQMSIEQDRRLKSMWTAILVAGVILLSLFMVLIFRQRSLRSGLQRTRAELALERSRKQALTLSLMLEENNKVINAIEEKLDTLPEAPAKLKSMLKVGRVSADDWRNFDEFFEKVHPRFQRVLREKYGIRSESRIKLACYIWMGLSSKQIAKLLVIEPSSVMKGRYRLRAQMGLKPGDSLEEALGRLE